MRPRWSRFTPSFRSATVLAARDRRPRTASEAVLSSLRDWKPCLRPAKPRVFVKPREISVSVGLRGGGTSLLRTRLPAVSGGHLVGTSKIILNRLCEPQPHTGEPEELNAPLRTMFAPRKDVMGTPDSGRGKAV